MSEEQNGLDISKLYEQSFKSIREGHVIKGKIVDIGHKEVLIDVGFKSEGVIPVLEFRPEELILGNEIEVFVESTEDEKGMIVLSREKAIRFQGWEKIVKNFQEGDLTNGRVTKKVKGGYIVDVSGTEGFLPSSLSAFRGVADKDIINKSFKFKVIKINSLRRSLVLSRKEALQKEKEESKGKLWGSLAVGELRSGVVKGITDFGAFIDLGGIDGLLHITDMSWSKITHPSEILAIGDKIDVMVLNVDKETNKVSLGLKQRLPDPWQDIETKYPVGSKVKGKVVNILPYGVFMELEKGIEGLIHISEVSWAKRITNLSEMFAVGDIIESQVMNIDKDSRRISLSIRQLEINPWLGIQEKYPVGNKVSGKVKGLTDYGAFIELEDNLEGMIHISDISWTKRPSHPQEVMRKGQKVEVVVLSVDAQIRRISLGLKQLNPNPWPEISKRYPVGTICEAEVVNVLPFGVFVKLEEDLEGLIYSNEIDKETMTNTKPFDKLKVKVIKVDVEQAKIGLSTRF